MGSNEIEMGESSRPLKVWMVGLLIAGALYLPQTPGALVCLESELVSWIVLPMVPVVMPLYWFVNAIDWQNRIPEWGWLVVGMVGVMVWGYGLFMLSCWRVKLFWIGLVVSAGVSSYFCYAMLEVIGTGQ